jgi:hypothetical protein
MRYFVTVLLSCVAATAAASPDPVVACRDAHAGDSVAHIACLEQALRAAGVSQADGTTPGRAAAATASAAVASATPAASPVAASPAAATVPQPTGLGAEQAKARQRSSDEPLEQVAVRVVSVGYNSSGLGVFTLADGQVWRETVAAPERHRLRAAREYVGRIERGSIGGYRMYLDGVKWMFKVERLK